MPLYWRLALFWAVRCNWWSWQDLARVFEQLDTASCNASEAPLATQVNKSDKPGVRPSHAFMFEVAVWYSLARAHCTAVVALSASQNHPTRWAVSAGLTDAGSLMPSTIGCRPHVGNGKGSGLTVSGECENLRLLAFLLLRPTPAFWRLNWLLSKQA